MVRHAHLCSWLYMNRSETAVQYHNNIDTSPLYYDTITNGSVVIMALESGFFPINTVVLCSLDSPTQLLSDRYLYQRWASLMPIDTYSCVVGKYCFRRSNEISAQQWSCWCCYWQTFTFSLKIYIQFWTNFLFNVQFRYMYVYVDFCRSLEWLKLI